MRGGRETEGGGGWAAGLYETPGRPTLESLSKCVVCPTLDVPCICV